MIRQTDKQTGPHSRTGHKTGYRQTGPHSRIAKGTGYRQWRTCRLRKAAYPVKMLYLEKGLLME
jgi:hypothetical protein